jgi:putative ubiquitin-RnfH superfamily antitoxin RatB of RatAB toxin-antitoxin module
MADAMRVSLVYSPAPREVREWRLELRAGSTVADAIAASGLAAGDMTIGVWGRKVSPAQVLHDRDRVEVYRPLKVDPKVARRERFRKQGARAAGLFKKR